MSFSGSDPPILKLLDQRRKKHPNLPVLIESESGRTWTAPHLLGARDTALGSLDRRRVRAGDRVAVVAEPCGETLAWILAAWTRGVAVLPLLPGLPPAEIDRLVEDAGATLLVDTPRGVIQPIDRDEEEWEPIDPDTALLFYTSGTSGLPKGVPHTHAGLLANIEALRSAWALSENDRLTSCLPWNHVHGLWVSVLGALVCGFPIVQARRFPGIAAFYEGIRSYRPTLVFGVPTFWADLSAPGAPRPPKPTPLRLIVSGSAALPAAIRARVREHFGLELLERYGMTETGMVLSQRLDVDRSAGSGMVPLPGVEVRLTEEGELEVRGRSVTSGYWRRQDATGEAFCDGWMRTGDLAERVGDGYRIVGRTSLDIIKCRGFKIAAPEIEQVLLEHPGIIECAVVGVPEDRLGEEVVAVLVLAGRGKLDEKRLRAYLADRLAGHKIPQRFVRLKAIPRTPVGKTAKGELRDQLARGEVS